MIDVTTPKLPSAIYFPDWLLERRRRAEQTMISVVATSYVLGVSTRRTEGLVQQLGIMSKSKSKSKSKSPRWCATSTSGSPRSGPASSNSPWRFISH